jgi:hypothetical protein
MKQLILVLSSHLLQRHTQFYFPLTPFRVVILLLWIELGDWFCFHEVGTQMFRHLLNSVTAFPFMSCLKDMQKFTHNKVRWALRQDNSHIREDKTTGALTRALPSSVADYNMETFNSVPPYAYIT